MCTFFIRRMAWPSRHTLNIIAVVLRHHNNKERIKVQGEQMRFFIPALSLTGLVLAAIWILFTGQDTHPEAVRDSSLMAAMPYLMLFLFIVQGALLFVMTRSSAFFSKKNVSKTPPFSDMPTARKFKADWVLEGLPDGVIVCNQQGEIIYVNTSAEKMLAWGHEDMQGKHVRQFLKLEDLQGNSLTEKLIRRQPGNHPAQPLPAGQAKLFPRAGEFRFVDINTNCLSEHCQATVLVLRDVTADRKVINRLYRQASRDGLTDLMNRTSFEQYIGQLAHDTSGLIRSHVLASIDLDNFKIINDTCGHLAGDELLKQVAQVFRRSVRTSDKVARIGGDEFAVFLEGCNLDKGRSIMESILSELRNFRFSWEGKVFTIGASIGLLEFMPSANLKIKELFADADKACYTAKALGRNRVFIHERQPSESVPDQRVNDWSKLLKNALHENRFILFAQPVKPLQTSHKQRFHQYEILLRLPFRQTLLNPGSFLPVADRLDLMTDIDRWIIRKSLEMLQDYHKKQSAGKASRIRLMINLSAQTVQDPELFKFVSSQLKHFAIDPGSLCFEIAESVAISNFIHTKQVMNALHGLGCHLVLDDFGSGFSSLNYLRELPLSYLKIDGNFIHNLVSSPVDAATYAPT